jgi:predicted nuclease of predicted toxin-antitoxin system
MKLLVDSCVPRLVAEHARAAGHDVIWAGARRPDPGDEALLDQAVEEGRVIVKIDTDFGTLVFRDVKRSVGVLRLQQAIAAHMASTAVALLGAYGQELECGCFVTETERKVRVSRPP